MSEPRRLSASVVIVGGGPVGLALAVTLGKTGISCVLVERQLEPSAIPRGRTSRRAAWSTSTTGAAPRNCARPGC